MAAGIKDIAIEAGATFRLSLAWLQPGPDDTTDGKPYDLTGATAQMQIRQRLNADVLIDLDTSSGITLSGTTGIIDILIPWKVTAALVIRKGVYDLFVSFPNGNGREKVLKGKVSVDQAVTLADADDDPVDDETLPSAEEPVAPEEPVVPVLPVEPETPEVPTPDAEPTPVVTQPEANPDVPVTGPDAPAQVDPVEEDTPAQEETP